MNHGPRSLFGAKDVSNAPLIRKVRHSPEGAHSFQESSFELDNAGRESAMEVNTRDTWYTLQA